MVRKTSDVTTCLSLENGQNVWHLTKTCLITNLDFLLTPHSPLPVCLHTLIERFPLPLLLFSNDYMPTSKGLINCVRNKCVNTNFSRSLYPSKLVLLWVCLYSIYYSFTLGCPPQPIRKWSSSLLVNVEIRMSVCKTNLINLRKTKVKY